MTTISQQTDIITLTPSAVEQIKTILNSDPENAGKPLRVYVEAGGCSGMQYGLVFDEAREGDRRMETEGIEVVIDAVSAGYITGAQVDFIDSLTGGGFKISNPNARHGCGCGKSFEA
jgi:iron-sulfur cluster assembly accessory protein